MQIYCITVQGDAVDGDDMKLISVVTPCYNEEDNVEELHRRIQAAFDQLPGYTFEHIYIDNASTDGTVAAVKRLAAADPTIKLIVNARNFGHIRSPMHAMLQARGEAVINMCSDLQDPPERIPEFVRAWEAGHPWEDTFPLRAKRTLQFAIRSRASTTPWCPKSSRCAGAASPRTISTPCSIWPCSA